MELNRTVLLTSLLPSSSYTLAYTLPLLLSSLCLTFAGAFLTLDRSRSFPPKYDSVPGDFIAQKRPRKFHWLLEGGIGGLASGYVFGVHLSTFLSLMIPSLSSSAPLSSKSFLSVWLLSAIVATFLSGRWRYCALVAAGMSGGSTFGLALAVIIHPSLLTRVILTAIILPILMILTILPLPRFQRNTLRFSLSATGAFGVVLSISLLTGVESWADVWVRFWVPDGPWGSSREKGLSAAYCFLLIGGMGCDWVLRYKFGENPDQQWDSYLATYSTNLPDRAGTFQPLTSVWSRLFGLERHATPPEIVFPTDEELKSTPLKLQKRTSISKALGGFEFQDQLNNGRSQSARERAGKRTRDPAKFGSSLSDSDSDSGEDELKTPLGFGKPWLEHKRASSPPVSVGFAKSLREVGNDNIDVEKESAKVKAGLGAHEEYSDFEEDDITSAAAVKQKRDRDAPGWSPDFLRRHGESGGSSTTSQRTAVDPSVVSSAPAPEGAVPITPSLIKAIDRITIAQQAVFGAAGVQPRPGFPPSKSSNPADMSGLPRGQVPHSSGAEEDMSARWDAFWRDVHEKAAHAR